MIRLNRIRRRRPADRRATAVVELAVCLPALVLLVIGTLECTSMIFLRQSLSIAAYEGVRVAIRSDTRSNRAPLDRSRQVLEERGIDGYAQVGPGRVGVVPPGEIVHVTVGARVARNAVLPLRFFSGTLTATARMIKE